MGFEQQNHGVTTATIADFISVANFLRVANFIRVAIFLCCLFCIKKFEQQMGDELKVLVKFTLGAIIRLVVQGGTC